MPYLFINDFKALVQKDNLQQVIGYDNSNLNYFIQLSVTEASSYLKQKYDIGKEFTDITVWSNGIIYKGRQRVYLTADAYSASIVYATNQLCLQAGNVYESIAGNPAHTFDVAEWNLLGAQYDIFFAGPTAENFDYAKSYVIGDTVFYKDKIYTAIKSSGTYSSPLGSITNGQQGMPNGIETAFPDDASFWGTGVAYTVAAGTAVTDISKWTKGDNRNAQMVAYCIDIALYHAHSRISPNNVPEVRENRYHCAIAWLKDTAKGNWISADIPLLQPKKGGTIRWGGNKKLNNSY
jgi:hypothetical protein